MGRRPLPAMTVAHSVENKQHLLIAHCKKKMLNERGRLSAVMYQ